MNKPIPTKTTPMHIKVLALLLYAIGVCAVVWCYLQFAGYLLRGTEYYVYPVGVIVGSLVIPFGLLCNLVFDHLIGDKK